MLHPAGQRGLRRTYEQMPVRVHQTVGQDVPAVPLGGFPEQSQAEVSVPGVQKHRLAIVSVHGNVLDSAGTVDSEWARHGQSLRFRL
jgi:hypothetical protein